MSNSVQQTGSSNAQSIIARSGGGSIAGSLFMLFAIELLLIGMVVWSFLINRQSYPECRGDITDPVWGLIALAAGVWGTWYLIMSRQATRNWKIPHSRNLLAIVVACGAILLGILLLNIATLIARDSVYMDIRPLFSATGGSAKSETVAAIVGDAATGKKWFSQSCVTCHGPTGDGVANAAPSLRASDFLKTADDVAIASLIRNGRTAADPANKTGKVMPAKGGNPFLDESKIADLVAFLLDLDAQFGSQTSATTDTAEAVVDAAGNQVATPTTLLLNRWVVPAATSETAPTSWATSTSTWLKTFVDSTRIKNTDRYNVTFSWLFVIATSVLAVHFLWVIGSGTAIVMHRELQLSSSTQMRLAQQTFLFWSIGVGWLVLWFLLFFLVG